MVKRVKRGISAFFIALSVLVIGTPNLYADSPKSAHYLLNESSVGAGGLNQSASASYLGQDSIGSVAVGQAASTNYQVQSGTVTPSDPALSASINGTVNFSSAFSAATASTATTTFTISNYTTYGYVAQIYGNPPSNGSTAISAMGTTGPSVAGSSQFGINLVANTLPVSVGANPNNGQFGFGTVATNYATSNSYRYVSGETIAQATKNSGLTTYTITFLVNVPALTPGGIYTSNQTLIVTGTY